MHKLGFYFSGIFESAAVHDCTKSPSLRTTALL